MSEKHPINDLVRLDDVKDILLDLEDIGDFSIDYQPDTERPGDKEAKDLAFCELVRDTSQVLGEEPFTYYGYKVVERRGVIVKTPAYIVITPSKKWFENEKDRIRFENPRFDRENNVIDPPDMNERISKSIFNLMVDNESINSIIGRLKDCLGDDFISHKLYPRGLYPIYLISFNFYEFDEYSKRDTGYPIRIQNG